MAKRYLCVVLMLVLVISCFSFEVTGTKEVIEAANSNTNDSISIQTERVYSVYKQEMTEKNNATQEITISGTDYNKTADVKNEPGQDTVLWGSGTSSATWDFQAAESGIYAFGLTYETFEGDIQPIQIGVQIDQSYPFIEAKSLQFKRYFQDFGEIRKDNQGNEISREQQQVYGVYTETAKDTNNVSDYLFYLERGTHTLTLTSASSAFRIKAIHFAVPKVNPSYQEYLNRYSSSQKYSGNELVTEGESAFLKSENDLIALSDNSSANVYPADAYKDKINYIGGRNWDQPGDEISWKVSVPTSGFYKIGVNYRQQYTLNTTFYREMKIDGAVPFSEAAAVAFPYARTWTFQELSDKKNQAYLFYLTAGEHVVSLSVTLGPLSDSCDQLDKIIENLASLYRSIVMITGDSPDMNRDYNLFLQIPDMTKQLTNNIGSLQAIKEKLIKATGTKGSSAVSVLNNMINVLEKMRTNKYIAHRYKDRYYSCYASVSSMLLELKKMSLDIDRIVLNAPDQKFLNTKTGMLTSITFSAERFFASFVKDYSSSDQKSAEKLTIWVNWGRDQAKVLKYLIQNDFSTKHNIAVDIKITNATLIHAALSGNSPDVALHLSRSEPVNLAMRGTVYDLSKFEDYGEIEKRFMPTASVPYRFQGGTYALPDTQSFFMMFIRTDILKQLGLAIPKTWDEFKNTAVKLQRKNMQVGLPYLQITDMSQVNLGAGALSIFPTLLIQKGEKLYHDNGSATNLLSSKSIEAFDEWTDYYNRYSYPLTYDFFNRFRVGLMPMAIQSYTMYAALTAAAPEIKDSFIMTEIPGYAQEDGSINNNVTGGGTGAVILEKSKDKKAAWEFIKWWTSADIQYKYGTEIETILGPAARVATANVEALKKYTWDKVDLENLLGQWKMVEELPEVPGGYYIPRVLDQAFWNTVNSGENSKDMLLKWTKIAETEISRKREQYGVK